MSVERVSALFAAAFGRPPAVVASAPGRVNLIGEHIDYNGGAVLPIAIAQRTWVAMAPGDGHTSRAVSGQEPTAGEWAPTTTAPAGEWWDYVAGALGEARALGGVGGAVNVAIWSDVPAGAGLSSSAALEVATVLAALAVGERQRAAGGEGAPRSTWPDLRALAGDGGDRVREAVARAAHRAEVHYVGVACGIMDQYASALCRAGHALHLHCDTGAFVHRPFGRGVLIVDSGVPRALRASAFNQRQDECRRALAALQRHDPALTALAHASPALLAQAALPEPLARRATHVVSEAARVEAFVRVLERRADAPPERGEGDGELGVLLHASHRSLRDDYECSANELDWIADHVVARVGIDGARLTGAGWGGCAIVVGDPDALAQFAPELTGAFELAWGVAPRTWLTTPHDGASIHA